MELTSEQLTFLRWHEITLDSLFDASGLAGAALKKAMEADGKIFAYNTRQCNNGHTLKSRAGHCIQCRPVVIGYLKRHFAEGYVYVGVSVRGKLIKIGTTLDLERRKWQLNNWQYGGEFDWQIIAFAHTNNAGRVERESHGRLARYSVDGEYIRAGKRQRCIELFRCNFSDAKKAIEQSLGGISLDVDNDERALSAFNFREIEK